MIELITLDVVIMARDGTAGRLAVAAALKTRGSRSARKGECGRFFNLAN